MKIELRPLPGDYIVLRYKDIFSNYAAVGENDHLIIAFNVFN